VAQCATGNNFWAFADCFEDGPHGLGHIAVGGVMADAAASPSDPAFYAHHGFVDHAWRSWQNQNSPARLSDMNGPLAGGSGTATLDTVLEMRGLMENHPVRAVMDTTNNLLCYRYDV